MFALDDFLSLLGHPVKLHIFSTLHKVFDLPIKSLILVHHLLQSNLVFQNVDHVVNLSIASKLDLVVLQHDILFRDQNGVFVISSYRQLRDLNLALLQVNDNFEVVLKLLNPYMRLALLIRSHLILLL